MKPQATRKPTGAPRPRELKVYRPPADGRCLASWPILMAQSRHAIRASRTASEILPPAYGTPTMIENATAAAGAMWVIDWNRVGARPTALRWSRCVSTDVLMSFPPLGANLTRLIGGWQQR